jgi:uncharacterized membrane protein
VRFEESVEIDAPIDRVWTTFTDFEKWPSWTASVRAIESIDGGPLRLGMRLRITQPRLPTTTWTVSDVLDGRSWSWEARRLGARTVAEHRLDSVTQGSTRLTQVVRQTGPVGLLAGVIYARLTHRYLAMESSGLKRACEGSADSHS